MWLLVLPASAQAATWIVDAAGGGDFSTIGTAVAASSPGDRIEVRAGTYAESIDLGARSLSVVAVDGPGTTVIEATGMAHAARIGQTAGAPSELSGFEVRGAPIVVEGGDLVLRDLAVFGATGVEAGAALVVDGGDTRVIGSALAGGDATLGGLVAVHAGSATFEDCVLSGGDAALVGGAAYVAAGASLTLERTTVERNDAAAGGGAIYLDVGATLTATDSTFTENHTATGGGGAIYADAGAVVTMTGGALTSNHSDDPGGGFGGAISLGAATADLTGVTLDGNSADYGGGIVASGGTLTLNGCAGSSNTATYGGALYVESSGVLTDTGSTWLNNTALSYGGGLWLAYGASAELTDVTFTDSTALYGSGGAITAYDAQALELLRVTMDGGYAYYGAGLYAYAVDDTIAIVDSVIRDGFAQYGHGGGIYAYYNVAFWIERTTIEGNVADYEGGGIYQYYGRRLVMQDSHVVGNRANRAGGGVWAYSVRWPVDLQLAFYGTTFEGNDAAVAGGGLYAFQPASLVMDGVDFVSNSVDPEGFGGGALVSAPLGLTVTSSRFANNLADYGGALYLEDVTDPKAALSVSHSLFQETRAAWCGALCVSRVAAPVVLGVHHSVFVANAATEDAAAVGVIEGAIDVYATGATHHAEGVALVAWDRDSVTRSSVRWAGLWGNAVGDVTGLVLDDDDVRADPAFTNFTLDGDPSDDSFVLDGASPWIDAADPAEQDPDGSRADIGLWGGAFTEVDGDGDGFTNAHDCDDADRTVFPGADDEPYDGVNHDCGPGSDYDADGDGAEPSWLGGDDCDDEDPAIILGCEDSETEPSPDTGAPPAPEGPDDAADPAVPPAASCGCGPAGRPSAALAVPLAAALLLRRRRPS
jgi:predicted outer membrane repeat protein